MGIEHCQGVIGVVVSYAQKSRSGNRSGLLLSKLRYSLTNKAAPIAPASLPSSGETNFTPRAIVPIP